MKAYKEWRYSSTPAQPRHYIEVSDYVTHRPFYRQGTTVLPTEYEVGCAPASLGVVEKKITLYFNLGHPVVFEY